MHWLLMWLEGPLQSWGSDSRFGRRESLPFPTRSGILGLLCAASGRTGEQEAWLAEMSTYEQIIISYVRKQASREIQLRDFHMVGSGYDKADAWQALLIPKKSDGTTAVGGGTKITHRAYLQDAAFACILELAPDASHDIAAHLQRPVWDLSLGRKCCVPTDFIYRAVYSDRQEALDAAAALAEQKERREDFRILEGEHPSAHDTMLLADVPLSFGRRKLYRERMISRINHPS